MQFHRLSGAKKGASAHALRHALPCLLTFLCASAAFAQQPLPTIDVGLPFGPRAGAATAPANGANGGRRDDNGNTEHSEEQIVVTPDRVEEPRSRTASSISVIPAAQVERRGSLTFTDVLRGTPGLDIYGFGGPGAQSNVGLRGSTPAQTLVLIDGIRVGDPSSGSGEADFGSFAIMDIERIEVLRGPQSALYGSQAMGGVINIITRKGEGKPRGSALAEGGSYGTAHSRASISGSEGNLSYAFAVDGLNMQGFPRYGYRIARPLTMADRVTPLPPLPPNDPTRRGGASARLGYRFTEDFSVEAGFIGFNSAIRFDNPGAFIPANVFNPYNHQTATFGQGYVRGDLDLFDRLLHNRLTLFGNVTNRDVSVTETCYDLLFNSFNCRLGYRGGRRGLEYQGDLNLGAFGLVTFGARNDTESIHTSQDPAPPGTFTPTDAAYSTHSGFAQHQFTLLDRLDITYGGRIDAVDGIDPFKTWRATAAYRLEETGTKIRGTAGTGARVGSLFERFSQYGDPDLRPERSIGYDAGFDQKFFDGRITASVSFFYNRYNNLIGFGASPTCTATQALTFGGCYYNVGKAETKGVEFSGEAVIAPNELNLRATYTHMTARNLETDRSLYLRARDKGSVSLIYSGIPRFKFEARMTAAGYVPAFDYVNFRRVALAPYARVDLYANYKINDQLSIFGRIENIGNTRYEETYNYGTPGRSVYGGVKIAW